MSFPSLDLWPARLEEALDRCGRHLRAVRVVAETGSTQDVARELDWPPGLVVVAGRQTAGRGRLGRGWADTGDEGIALTAVVRVESDDAAERLVLASAVAAARAIDRAAGLTVGIKWPNDLVVDGRKLAGILIERRSDIAAIGVGINVAQRSFPAELAERATSVALAAHGAAPDRLEVLAELLPALDAALAEPLAGLEAAFHQRDALRGGRASFETPFGVVEGTVHEVRPTQGLLVDVGAERRFLAAATTSVRWWKPGGASSR